MTTNEQNAAEEFQTPDKGKAPEDPNLMTEAEPVPDPADIPIERWYTTIWEQGESSRVAHETETHNQDHLQEMLAMIREVCEMPTPLLEAEDSQQGEDAATVGAHNSNVGIEPSQIVKIDGDCDSPLDANLEAHPKWPRPYEDEACHAIGSFDTDSDPDSDNATPRLCVELLAETSIKKKDKGITIKEEGPHSPDRKGKRPAENQSAKLRRIEEKMDMYCDLLAVVHQQNLTILATLESLCDLTITDRHSNEEMIRAAMENLYPTNGEEQTRLATTADEADRREHDHQSKEGPGAEKSVR